MISWFDKHRRLRDRLSAYIDAELEADAVRRLEEHLARCEPCRGELEQLRATAAALRELPEAALPRSFVLDPERVAARRPAPAAAWPLSLAPRIVAAGLAVALAAVLVVDIGDIGGGGAGDEATIPGTINQMSADQEAPDTGGPAAPATGGAAPEAAPSPEEQDVGRTLAPGSESAETPAAGPEEAEAPAAPASGGGGLDALTAAEIALAAALGLAVAGSVVQAFAGRER